MDLPERTFFDRWDLSRINGIVVAHTVARVTRRTFCDGWFLVTTDLPKAVS